MRRNKVQVAEKLFKQNKDVQLPPVIAKELKSQAHKSGDFFTKNSKFFRMNFEILLAISECNKIYVVTGREFAIIDVLYGHSSPVKCLDISPFTKDIISFSADKLILHRIHEMPDNPNFFADQAVLTTALSWDNVWERNLTLPISTLRFSTIGDFFVATGKEIFSLWKKEKAKPSFKSEVFFSVDKEIAIPSRKTEFLNNNQLGNIIHCEITVDGRFIITLEKNKRTLKIWYNDYQKYNENGTDNNSSQKFSGSLPTPFQPMGDEDDSPSNKILMMQNKTRKMQHSGVELKLRSMKELDNPGEGNEDEEGQLNIEEADDDKGDPIELEFYLLLNHKSIITSFKLMMPDLYEGFKNAIPTVLTTITEKGWIFLWYENLMDKNMSFMCAHVFKPNYNEVIYDMAFLDFPPIDPQKYHDLIDKKSGIFIPDTNKVMQIKRTHNKLGVYQNSYEGTTYDWIFLLKKEHLEIYKAEGLRNFPIKNINIFLKAEMPFTKKSLPKLNFPIKILRVALRDFNDKISFYGLNKSFQCIKYRKNLSVKSTKQDWEYRSILIAKRDIITDLLTHKDYPILLQRTITNEIWFYFEEQSAKEIVKYNNFRFIGQYNHNKIIKQICFINKIPGVIILNNNNSMTVVLSDTFLKVLGSHKYSKEFLEIWDSRKYTSYEKWVLADEYSLTEELGEEVKGIKIISTHFDKCTCVVKTLILYSDSYKIFDITVKISSFKEFIVEIQPISTKRLGFTVSKLLSASQTDSTVFHLLVKRADKNFLNSLIKVEVDENEINDKFSVLWTSDALKTDKIRVVLSPQYLGMLNDEEHILYIYDLIQEKYTGFIDLQKVIPDEMQDPRRQTGQESLLFGRNHAKGSLIVYYNDMVLLFSQINLEYLDSLQDESWTLIHKFDNILNISSIKSIMMEESYYGKLMFVVNNKYFLSRSKFIAKSEGKTVDEMVEKEIMSGDEKQVSLEGLFTIFQESKPIYHPQLLKQLYLKGHMNLIIKILCKLYSLMQFDFKSFKVPAFLDFSLDNILSEINLDKGDKKKAVPEKKKDTAASLFDDNMFSWDMDFSSKPLFDSKPKEEEEKEKEKK